MARLKIIPQDIRNLPEAKNYVSKAFKTAGEYAKKTGKFLAYDIPKLAIYDIPNALIRENLRIPDEVSTKDGLKSTAKGIFYLAKNAPHDLADFSKGGWWDRNKLYVASIAVPIAASITIGLTSTRYRLDLRNTISKNSALAKQLNQGNMLTYGYEGKVVDAMKWGSSGNFNPLGYTSPSLAFPRDSMGNPVIVEIGKRVLTDPELGVLRWYDEGGGIIEHIPAWAGWGAGVSAGKIYEHKKKK
jgi:hypothetical protein